MAVSTHIIKREVFLILCGISAQIDKEPVILPVGTIHIINLPFCINGVGVLNCHHVITMVEKTAPTRFKWISPTNNLLYPLHC